MTAATADRNTSIRPTDDFIEQPVNALSELFVGTFACHDAEGYIVPGANTLGLRLAGLVDKYALGGAADGAVNVRLRRRGQALMTAAGLTQADVGKPVFLSDNQTVTLTPTNVFAGFLAAIDSAEAWVDFAPAIGAKGDIFVLDFFHPGTVGAATVTVRDGLELPKPFRVLRGYADCLVAPGAGYNCAVTITDGTTPKSVTIAEAAVHGEDEAIDQVYAANTDIDITLLDDNASASTANVSGGFICETLY